MRQFFRNTITLIAVPFLAVVALALKGVRTGVQFAFGLVGWELAWPPVLVDEPDAEVSSPIKPRTRNRRSVRRRGSGSR